MDADSIRKLKEADPFVPFKLILESGEVLLVDRRAGIGIAPEGKFFVYALEPDGYRVLRPREVKVAQAVGGNAA